MVAGELANYGYSHEVLLPVDITVPPGLREGQTVTFVAEAEWLVVGDYFLDAAAFIDTARERHADLPLFLLGHSMGGLITISYTLRHPSGLSGADPSDVEEDLDDVAVLDLVGLAL